MEMRAECQRLPSPKGRAWGRKLMRLVGITQVTMPLAGAAARVLSADCAIRVRVGEEGGDSDFRRLEWADGWGGEVRDVFTSGIARTHLCRRHKGVQLETRGSRSIAICHSSPAEAFEGPSAALVSVWRLIESSLPMLVQRVPTSGIEANSRRWRSGNNCRGQSVCRLLLWGKYCTLPPQPRDSQLCCHREWVENAVID